MGRVAKYKKHKKFDLHRSGESGWDNAVKSKEKGIPRSLRKLRRQKAIMKAVEEERSKGNNRKKSQVLQARREAEKRDPRAGAKPLASKKEEKAEAKAEATPDGSSDAPKALTAEQAKIKTVQKVAMRSDESFSDFTKRLSTATRSDLEDINNRKVSRSRFWQVRAEKKKAKKARRSEKYHEEDKLGFGKLKDRVGFGDVVEAPPSISSVPKNRKRSLPLAGDDDAAEEPPKKRQRTYEAKDVETEEETAKRVQKEKLASRQVDIERERAVQKYKEAKRKRKLEARNGPAAPDDALGDYL